MLVCQMRSMINVHPVLLLLVRVVVLPFPPEVRDRRPKNGTTEFRPMILFIQPLPLIPWMGFVVMSGLMMSMATTLPEVIIMSGILTLPIVLMIPFRSLACSVLHLMRMIFKNFLAVVLALAKVLVPYRKGEGNAPRGSRRNVGRIK